MAKSTEYRRVNEQLEEYWQQIRGSHDLPMETEINPDAIENIWDSCFMIRHEPEDDHNEFRYMYLGEHLIEAYGDEGNDRENCEKLAYPLNATMVDHLRKVIQTKKPVTLDAEFTNSKGMIIKYRACLLPLAKDNRAVAGYIVGGMKWKAH